MLDARTDADASSPPPPPPSTGAMASPPPPATLASPPPSPPPLAAPPLPPSSSLSRRRSSVSSATTVAAMRSAGFRARTVQSADEKRVTFRATPTVRYFKSTHTASFGSDTLDSEYEYDGEESTSESSEPRWRAMRARRIRHQLKATVVTQHALADVDASTRQLVAKIAQAARQRVETSVCELLDGTTTVSSAWTKRADSRFRALRGRDDKTEATWERRDAKAHEVVVCVTLPCKFRELQRVLETTRHDELDAALLACAHERIDRAALLETVETTTTELRAQQQLQLQKDTFWTDPRKETTSIAVTRVVQPRTKMVEASHVWRRIRREETSAALDEEIQEFIDVVTMPPSVKSAKPPLASRVLTQMASLSRADHALVGEMQVGFVLQPSHEKSAQETSVALFLSRKRKPSKSFAWSASTVSDALIARLGVISSVLWSYVERRRLGFQVLAYPDTVYCVGDIKEAEADVTHCPFCDNEFGFLRQRHFCHSCALWVCVKCSSDEDVNTHTDGWTMESVKVCLACQGRVDDCVFDYDRSTVSPCQRIVESDPEAASFRCSRRLAQSWIHLLQRSSGESDHQVQTLVLDTLMTLLTGEECGFRLSGLDVDWEDLDPDEMVESVEELAEMLPVPFLSRRDCLLSHDSHRRQYVLVFNEETGIPQSPTTVDDADRVQRVEKLSLLEIPAYPSLDVLCALAATDLGCQMAFVSTILTDRTVLLAKYGTSTTQRERDDGMCAYTLQSIHPLVVLDMARDIRSRYFSLTTDEGARFYCGVPLFSPDETFVMATFALVDTQPREAIGTSDYATFMAFARAARALLMRELEERSWTPASGA